MKTITDMSITKNGAGHKILTIVFTAIMLLGLLPTSTLTALAVDAGNLAALKAAAASGGLSAWKDTTGKPHSRSRPA